MNSAWLALLLFLTAAPANAEDAKSEASDRAELAAIFREPPMKDRNLDGEFDTWNFFYADNTRRELREDRNFDGKADWYEYYAEDGRLTRRLRDRNFDGKIDQWEYFSKEGPVVSTVKIDSNLDGKLDKIIEVILSQAKLEFKVQADSDFNGSFESVTTAAKLD